MKSVQQYRDFVRLATDSDTEDVPDSLIDEWLQEGVQQIRQKAVDWPWYRSTATTVTVNGQAEYSLPTTTDGNTLRDVIFAKGPYDPLQRLTEREGQTAYFTSVGSSSQSGPPLAFSIWGNTLTLWPTPNDAYTVKWFGYRELDGWYADASSVPDVPTVAEGCLNSWMLSRAFLHLSDTELASNHKSDFDERLTRLVEDQLSASRWGPVVHGDGWGRYQFGRGPRFHLDL